MKRTFSIPTLYIERLLAEKEATGLNLSEILRRAIDVYFKKNEPSTITLEVKKEK